MEKPPTVKPNHRSRTMPRKKEGESGAPVRERRHHQKPPKAGHHAGAPSVKKEKREMEKTETNQEKVDVEKEAEVKLKSTVVDIDSVRENKVQEENLWLLEAAEQDGLKCKSLGVFEWLLMVFALSLVLLFLPISIWFCVKVVREHERAVIFRLGYLLRGKPRGPGLLFYLPLLDVCHKVDIRLRMLKVPSHMVVTKDLMRPELSAVCYYQIENVALCSTALSNLTSVLQSLVQAAIRDVFAQHTFSHILQHRRRIGEQIQKTLDSVTCRWGVKVDRTDIDELSFPVELQQSLAADAEAKRQQQFTQVKVSEREAAAWEGFRASFRHLQPALVLPLAPDLLNMNSDLASLPPPPPLSEDGGDMIAASERDSPMM